MKIFIKICGIKRPEDAVACYEANVDAIGFIFFKNSPRFISPDYLKDMINDLPPITKIGVFPEMDDRILRKKCKELSLEGIQVYHDLKENFNEFLKIRGIFYPNTQVGTINFDFLLFDFKNSSFERIPIDLAIYIKKEFVSIPIMFAGNLNKENIKEFIKKVKPFGVDISRGVEKSPGIKDKNLIFEIVNKIREAENET